MIAGWAGGTSDIVIIVISLLTGGNLNLDAEQGRSIVPPCSICLSLNATPCD
jgi:hypothetical protein